MNRTVLSKQATKIELFSLATPPMRTFHATWVAFFLTFVAWFGIAPLMPLIRDELGLSQEQVANTVIASVAGTIVVRLLVGWLCDALGPRRSYALLLALGSLPVMSVALVNSYESLLFVRLLIGGIGASFVITQYHTSVMFAPNVVGTAAATTAGWGNLGGGAAQVLTPFVCTLAMSLGLEAAYGWRIAMLVPGLLLLAWSVVYLRFTQDYPAGNMGEVERPAGKGKSSMATFMAATRDPCVWILAAAYAGCFGIELTFHNMSALYFKDRFGLGLTQAGLVASVYGGMNLFTRTCGGALADKMGARFGVQGRVKLLGTLLLLEGLGLAAFSRMPTFATAAMAMIAFGFCTQMASGATYAVVPFVNRAALGAVAGIVGAGGNLGAVIAGFAMRDDTRSMADSFAWMGLGVASVALIPLLVPFRPIAERTPALAPEVAQSAA